MANHPYLRKVQAKLEKVRQEQTARMMDGQCSDYATYREYVGMDRAIGMAILMCDDIENEEKQ